MGSDNIDEEPGEEVEVERATTLLREATRNVVLTEMDLGDDEEVEQVLQELQQEEEAKQQQQKKKKKTKEVSVPDEIIKKACVQTAMSSLGSVVPGLTAFTLGVAATATAGIQFNIRMKMIETLAEHYKFPLDSETKQRIWVILTGVDTGGSQAVSAISAAISERIAQQAANDTMMKAVPLIGPVTAASVAVTTTYVIGNRAKVFFSEGEEALSSWQDSVRALTGVDERKLSRWIKEAYALMKARVVGKFKAGANAARGSFRALANRLSFRRKPSKNEQEEDEQ